MSKAINLLAMAMIAVAAFAAPASHGEPASPYFKVLKDVPTSVRGLWCIYDKSEATTNEWTGNPAKEFAFKPCKQRVSPDVNITKKEFILMQHVEVGARCHVHRVAEFTGQGKGIYVLSITCQNLSLGNSVLVGTYPHAIFVGRGSKGDLRIVADIE